MSKNNYIFVKTNTNEYKVAYHFRLNLYKLDDMIITIPEDPLLRHKFFSTKWYYPDVFSVINHLKSLIEWGQDPYSILDSEEQLSKFILQHRDEFPEILL